MTSLPIPRYQSTVGLFWLSIITFGVYYFVWYSRVNNELSEILGDDVSATGKWWNQLIPVWNLVGLYETASKCNRANVVASTGQKPVGTIQIWLWRPFWFFTPHTCIQKRMNGLHTALSLRKG